MADDNKTIGIDVKGYGVVQVPSGLDSAGMKSYIDQQIKSGSVKQQQPKTDVADVKANDAPPGADRDQEGFSKSFVHALPNPVAMGKLGMDVINAGMNPSNVGQNPNLAKDVWEGVLAPQWEMVTKGSKSLSEGRPVESLDYYAASLAPGIGPSIMHGYEQGQKGNWRGAAGTWSGALATVAGSEFVPKALGRLRDIAPEVYRKGLDIKVGKGGVPRAEAKQAVERGLGREEPPNAPPDKPVVSSEPGFEGVEKRIAKTKQGQMAEISKADAAGAKIPTANLIAPLEKLIKRWEKTGFKSPVKPLQAALDDFNKQHPTSFIGPKDAQEFKETVDEILGEPAFAEDATLGGQKKAIKELRDEFKKNIEMVAPVKDQNWAMHLDYVLLDAVDRAINNRNFLQKLLTTGSFGGFTAYEALKGNMKVAGPAAGLAIVSAALQSPEAMTRLGVALDAAGIELPPIVKGTGRTAAALSQAGGKPDAESPPGADNKIKVKSADEIRKQWEAEAASGGKQ